MRELQAQIIKEMGVRPAIDPVDEARRRVAFMKDYLRATGASGYVLGISGGLDSTLAGKLAQLAIDELRAEGTKAEFVALRLPYGVQADEEDAQSALDFIAPGICWTFNVKPGVDGITEEFSAATGEGIGDFNKGNVKARARMIAQYAVAGQRNLLVLGTDHGAESVTGFFTKFGDGGADLLPLFGLDKGQIRSVLKHLGADEYLYEKVPTADLLDGKPGRTDEDELGFTYANIDAYLEGKDIPDDVAGMIEKRWRNSRHKRTGPVTVRDTWWH